MESPDEQQRTRAQIVNTSGEVNNAPNKQEPATTDLATLTDLQTFETAQSSQQSAESNETPGHLQFITHLATSTAIRPGDTIHTFNQRRLEDSRWLPQNRTFTPFPRLPPEMRLKIWEDSFEKQHVDLDLWWCIDGDMDVGDENSSGRPPSPYVPVTLAVNLESRNHTKKFYCTITSRMTKSVRTYILSGYIDPSPGWVNPSLDSFFFRLRPGWHSCGHYTTWFGYIAANRPKLLNEIQQLEIREAEIQEADDDVEEGEGLVVAAEHIASWFYGVKEVVLTAKSEFPDVETFPPDNWPFKMRDMAEEVRKVLEKRKDKFVGGVLPVVRARNHQPFYTGEKAFP